MTDSAQWSLGLPTLLGPRVYLYCPEGINVEWYSSVSPCLKRWPKRVSLCWEYNWEGVIILLESYASPTRY